MAYLEISSGEPVMPIVPMTSPLTESGMVVPGVVPERRLASV